MSRLGGPLHLARVDRVEPLCMCGACPRPCMATTLALAGMMQWVDKKQAIRCTCGCGVGAWGVTSSSKRLKGLSSVWVPWVPAMRQSRMRLVSMAGMAGARQRRQQQQQQGSASTSIKHACMHASLGAYTLHYIAWHLPASDRVVMSMSIPINHMRPVVRLKVRWVHWVRDPSESLLLAAVSA